MYIYDLGGEAREGAVRLVRPKHLRHLALLLLEASTAELQLLYTHPKLDAWHLVDSAVQGSLLGAGHQPRVDQLIVRGVPLQSSRFTDGGRSADRLGFGVSYLRLIDGCITQL